MTKQLIPRKVYTLPQLAIGDRFYFLDDRHKKVWEIYSDNSCMHLTEMLIFNQWSQRLVVYLRSCPVEALLPCRSTAQIYLTV